MKIKIQKILSLTLLVALFSCSKKIEDPEVLYQKSLNALYNKSFQTATKLLSDLDENYPYTAYSDDTIVLLAYSDYKTKKYSEVLGIVDFFIQINPRHENTPYLLYLKALSFYDQIEYYKKDKQILYEFMALLSIMENNFQNSIYTQDLIEKSKYVKEVILAGEVDVALQYQYRQNCIAAVNRYIEALKISNQESSNIMIKHNANLCLNVLGIESYSF